MNRRKLLYAAIALACVLPAAGFAVYQFNLDPAHAVGEVLDEFNGVKVFHNGGIGHNEGRNTSADGYNVGIKYQCVEFVKRYYFERFNHRMPETRGNAKDFFNPALEDGAMNPARGLVQFQNGGARAPQAEDIVVFAPWLLNRYGHVAIVTRVDAERIEFIQQNPGPFGHTRETLPLKNVDGRWQVDHPRMLGWLRREPEAPQLARNSGQISCCSRPAARS